MEETPVQIRALAKEPSSRGGFCFSEGSCATASPSAGSSWSRGLATFGQSHNGNLA